MRVAEEEEEEEEEEEGEGEGEEEEEVVAADGRGARQDPSSDFWGMTKS